MLKKGFLLAAFFLSVAIPLHAQITTAAIGGEVTDAQGRPVIGATVTAVHEPSGTRYAAAANADGRYVIRGMRAGGPYRVEIACFGMVDNRTGGITCGWVKRSGTMPSWKRPPCSSAKSS